MENATQPVPLIELRDIRKRYGGNGTPEVEVLKGVSLSIHAGEFVAIVGASGSGKSTLMNILGCLDRPSSGSYHFAGHDVAELDSDEQAWLRREAFGFVFQGYHLIPSASAQENVEMPAIYAGTPASERHTRARALLERLGLAERTANRPHQLSGGQQQRVSIARALMSCSAPAAARRRPSTAAWPRPLSGATWRPGAAMPATSASGGRPSARRNWTACCNAPC